MTEAAIEKRVDDLRSEMHRGFDQLEGDVRELRQEMRDLRSEGRHGFEKVGSDAGDLRAEMREGFEKAEMKTDGLRSEMAGLRGEMTEEFKEARSEFQEGLNEIRKLMIVFFGSTLGTIVAGVAVAVLAHS